MFGYIAGRISSCRRPKREELTPLECGCALVILTDHNPGKSFAAIKPAIDEIPTKEIHILNGAAHWSQWEKPSEVNSLMTEFLMRVDSEQLLESGEKS
jgi:hypothetical protein